MEPISMAFVLCLVFAGVAFSEENSRESSFVDLPGEDTQENDNHRNIPADNPILRYLESSPGQVVGHVGDDNVETLRQRLAQEDWNQFTPPPITVVECHIEFQVTKTLPGRCIKLGGHIPACQSEEFMEIDYEECR